MSRQTVCTLTLAAVAGFVDAVGFLTLFHLFTAHMSGNSVWFGSSFGIGDWRLGLHHLFPIPLFVLGVIVGTTAVELAVRRRARIVFAPVLALETALLAAFMAVGSASYVDGALRTEAIWAFYALAAVPALAMGLQNATLRQIAGRAVHTTYVTGVLQSFAEDLVRYAFWVRQQRRDGGRATLAHPALRAAAMSGLLWLAYVAGAIGGGFASHRLGLLALVVPLAVLIAVIVADLTTPLAAVAPEAR